MSGEILRYSKKKPSIAWLRSPHQHVRVGVVKYLSIADFISFNQSRNQQCWKRMFEFYRIRNPEASGWYNWQRTDIWVSLVYVGDYVCSDRVLFTAWLLEMALDGLMKLLYWIGGPGSSQQQMLRRWSTAVVAHNNKFREEIQKIAPKSPSTSSHSWSRLSNRSC